MEKCNQRKWVQIFHHITFPLHLSYYISNVITFTTVLVGSLAALPVQQYFKHWCCAFLSIINSVKESSIIQCWIQHNTDVDQKSDLWRVSYTLPWKVYCEHLGEKSLINWWFTVFLSSMSHIYHGSWQIFLLLLGTRWSLLDLVTATREQQSIPANEKGKNLDKLKYIPLNHIRKIYRYICFFVIS